MCSALSGSGIDLICWWHVSPASWGARSKFCFDFHRRLSPQGGALPIHGMGRVGLFVTVSGASFFLGEWWLTFFSSRPIGFCLMP